jgi:hypothetical protein
VVLVAALILGSHALHDGFAMIRWRAAGIEPRAAGLLWSEAVAAEIVVFFAIGARSSTVSGQMARRCWPRPPGVVRWTISARPPPLPALALIQPLHGLTFALLHLACMRQLAEIVPPRLSATALTLYGTVGIGAASTAQTLASGALYSAVGAGGFWVMGGLCAAALPIARRLKSMLARNRPKSGCGSIMYEFTSRQSQSHEDFMQRYRSGFRYLASSVGILIAFVLVRAASSTAEAQSVSPEVTQLAGQAIERERLVEDWPFESEEGALVQSKRRVILHYFPPFPLSFDNLPLALDYYSTQYLRADGEKGRYRSVGGYTRERPLPVGPWSVPQWRQVNFAIEVLRAQVLGADAFGVDLLQLKDGRYWTSAIELMDVATAVRPGFGIVPEPDTDVLKNMTAADLQQALTQIWEHKASYHLPDGRLLVAPFAAERRPVSFWREVVDRMAQQGMPIALLPVLLDAGRYARDYTPVSIGLSRWGAHNPKEDAKSADAHLAAEVEATGRAWMQPVVPQDERPKSGVFWESNASDPFRQQWAEARQRNADYVHLITWNDYGEATEVAPSTGTQYVFYDLAAYETRWFKLGRPPAFRRDAIYYLHRRQILDPSRVREGGDTNMHLRGATRA